MWGVSQHRVLGHAGGHQACPKGTGGKRRPGNPLGAPVCLGLSFLHAPRDTHSLPTGAVVTGPVAGGMFHVNNYWDPLLRSGAVSQESPL